MVISVSRDIVWLDMPSVFFFLVEFAFAIKAATVVAVVLESTVLSVTLVVTPVQTLAVE